MAIWPERDDPFLNITGLCDPNSLDLNSSPYWVQLSVAETLCVPDEKPDIEQLHSVGIEVRIFRTEVIVTPISEAPDRNWEGRISTGRKLIIEGALCQTVSYVGLVADQSLHSAHFTVPFSACIVLPVCINGEDPLDLSFQINPCVEDVFIKEVCPRQLFKNVTLLLQAVVVPGTGCR